MTFSPFSNSPETPEPNGSATNENVAHDDPAIHSAAPATSSELDSSELDSSNQDVVSEGLEPTETVQVLAPPAQLSNGTKTQSVSKPMLASALAVGAAGCVALAFWASKTGQLSTNPALVVAPTAASATPVPNATQPPIVFTAPQLNRPNPKATGKNAPKSAGARTEVPNANAGASANPLGNGSLPAGGNPARALSQLPPAPGTGGGTRPNAAIAQDFDRAVAAQKAGNIEEAIKWYRSVLQKQPAALEARTNMAILFAQNKQPAKAVEQLEAARKIAPENPAINWQLAQMQLALKKPDKALEPLRAVLKADPKNVPAHVLQAQILTETRKFPEAYQAWQRVAEMTPKDGQAALAAGSIALQELKKPAEAEKWLRRATALPPANPRAPLALAQALLAQKKAGSAVRVLAPAAKKYPEIIEFGTMLSDARAADGDLKGATSALRAVISKVPQKTGAAYGQLRWQMGRLLAGQKEWKDAQRELQAAAKELPKNADLRGALAEVALQANDKKAGVANLKTLLELDPKRVGARVVLAQVLAQNGDFKSANEQYRKYLQAKPGDATIVAERAVVLEKLGRTDDALKLWTRAEQLLPDNPLPMLQRGRVLRKAKRDKEALQAFRHVLQVKPNEPRALLNAAELETQSGQYSSAVTRWKALIAQEPGYDAAYGNLMESARNDRGNRQSLETAANFLKAQLAKNPSRPAAYRAILNSYQKAGRGKEGRAFVDNLARLHPKAQAPREALAAYDHQSKAAAPTSAPAPISTPTPTLTIAPPKPKVTPGVTGSLDTKSQTDATAAPKTSPETKDKNP